MTLTFGFYNSVSGDRLYNAVQISQIFDGLIDDGVYATVGDALMVSAYSGMQVSVGTGRAWFNHSWSYNDADILLTHAAADPLLPRIDSVVIEIDSASGVRANNILILTGSASASPVPPSIFNTDTFHQYRLANVYVGAAVTSITQANITNRVGTTDCPFVTGIIDTITTNDLLAQWEAEWEEWFDAIKDQLSTEAETNLQAQIWDLAGVESGAPPYATNMVEIMSHNHTDVGDPIGAAGLATGAVSDTKIQAGAVTTSKIGAAAVTAEHLDYTIAGNGLGGGGGLALYVKVDASTLEIVSDTVRVKDEGITKWKIQNRTRQVYIPATAMHQEGGGTPVIEPYGWMATLLYNVSSSNHLYGSFDVPLDLIGGLFSAYVVWTVASGSGNARYQIGFMSHADGEDMSSGMTASTVTIAAPTPERMAISYLGTLAPVLISNIVSFVFLRLGADALDTLTTNSEIFGLLFEYTADS